MWQSDVMSNLIIQTDVLKKGIHQCNKDVLARSKGICNKDVQKELRDVSTGCHVGLWHRKLVYKEAHV